MLAVTQLLLNLAHASPQTAVNANQQRAAGMSASTDERRKRRAGKTNNVKKMKATPGKKHRLISVNKKLSVIKKTASEKKAGLPTSSQKHPHRATRNTLKHYSRRHRNTDNRVANRTRLTHYRKARETAMTRLMKQLGRPYQLGGTSPGTGFDCSGLVWYAYKDLVKFRIPRTADEMYHLRNAPMVQRNQLEKGDLVFFRINGRGRADHVGVYLGGGRFIQSPRTGKTIQISQLEETYWQRHYIGARRVMTPGTIR